MIFSISPLIGMGVAALATLFSLSVTPLTPPAKSPAAAAAPTMKAIRYHAFGAPDVLKFEDAPKPAPKAGEVLIRVHAAAINPVDWKIRSGRYASRAGAFPVTPGFDVSGVIESVGPDVTTFKPNDEVFGFLALTRGGCYAEYVVASTEEIAIKPKSEGHIKSAAVPLAALTAWQAMFDTGKLQSGQTVLIHAGAGGVGHFAIQLAKTHGANVIATASAANLDFLKQLGADQVIDYKTTKFEDVAKDVDVVLDTIGQDTLERSYSVIKPGGVVVSIVQDPDAAKLKDRNIRGYRIPVKPNSEQLAKLAELVDAGRLKPHVSETLELKDAVKAHELSESGRTRGKIVLKVR